MFIYGKSPTIYETHVYPPSPQKSLILRSFLPYQNSSDIWAILIPHLFDTEKMKSLNSILGMLLIIFGTQ